MKRFLGLALLAVLSTSCATFAQKREPVVSAVVHGDYDRALMELQSLEGRKPSLLDLMDRGLILHLAGRFQESNQVLQAAETRIDELFAKSVSREAATYLINDLTQEYSGEPFERIWVNVLMAFNYINLNRLDDALVEIRKIDFKLQTYIGDFSDKEVFKRHAFAHYLSAMVHDAGGESSEAHVSLKKALQGYGDYEKYFDVPIPVTLQWDLLRSSKRLGYFDEYQQYRQRFPQTAASFEQHACLDCNDVVFLLSLGRIAHKEERAWSIEGEGGLLLRVPYPEFEQGYYALKNSEVDAGAGHYEGVVVENVSAIARKTLNERIAAIKGRAVARMLAKAGASAAAGVAVARQTNDPALGALTAVFTNMLLGLTERADTRSWLTLPAQVQMVRVSMPRTAAPRQTFKVRFSSGNGGQAIQTDVQVDFSKQRRAFVFLRAKE